MAHAPCGARSSPCRIVGAQYFAALLTGWAARSVALAMLAKAVDSRTLDTMATRPDDAA